MNLLDLTERLDHLFGIVTDFFDNAAATEAVFFNEAELQYEIGCWLRTHLPQKDRVFFERPVSSFFPLAVGLVKTEIDLVVEVADQAWRTAIEIKCPRNGRHPDTMFDACRDLQFLEQLVSVGFAGGIFVMHVDDPCFYERGSNSGIYAYFRAGQPVESTIIQPTAKNGKRDQIVTVQGSYRVKWQRGRSIERYWLQKVTKAIDKICQPSNTVAPV